MEALQLIRKKKIKNVTRCRDSRTAKHKETRYGWSHKTVKCTNPLRISFNYKMCWPWKHL